MNFQDFLNEGSKITLKRRYTENHPAVQVGKSARVRNKMLEAIADGKITQEEFDAILKEYSKDSSKWIRRNTKYFNVSEEGISLSTFGKRALSQIAIIEEGRAFVAAAKKAKDEGKEEFEFDGETFPVTIKENSEELEEELEEKAPNLAKKLAPGLTGALADTIGVPRGTGLDASVIDDEDGDGVEDEEDDDQLHETDWLKKHKKPTHLSKSKKPAIEVSVRYAREAGEAFRVDYSKMGKMTSANTFEFKNRDDAEEFAEYLMDYIDIPEEEITGWNFDESFVNEADKFEKEAKQILNDLMDEFDPWELTEMMPEEAKETVATYGHKGSKAKKIADHLYNLASTGTFESKNNKNNKEMKNNFIYESFNEFVETLKESVNESEEMIAEAFQSMKLQSILTGASSMQKDFAKVFYGMAKIQLDKIQDVDIIEMDPVEARKEKRNNAVYLYFTTNEKENPYAADSWHKTIPANTLLGATNGKNEWLASGYQRRLGGSRDRTLKTSKKEDAVGFNKSNARDSWGSGISSITKVAELADRAYVLDLDILKARYSTSAKRDERTTARKGAIAFKNDKDFKKENLDRYHMILADRAAKMPIDKEVLNAIDVVTSQIKDGLATGAKGKWGDVIIGKDPKGREVKLRDASNAMQNLLDDFNRYVDYTNQAKREEEEGYSSNYYSREVKNYAKSIKDRISKIKKMDYVW